MSWLIRLFTPAAPIVPGQLYRLRGSPDVWEVYSVVAGQVVYSRAGHDEGRYISIREFRAVATLVTPEEEQAFAEWRRAYREVGG